MIKKESMKIISTNVIAKETVEMVLHNEYISENAAPGQFLHISVSGCMLRRPLSIAAVDRTAKTVTILFKIIGKGTKRLSGYVAGETIDVLGPAGNGFPLKKLPKNDKVLLIGGGIGVPPLYFLGCTLKELGYDVQAVIGFQSKDFVFYEERFKKLGETIVVTNDGSYGEKGFVTDMVDKIVPFDRYYSCGPAPMLKAVTNTFKGKEGYLSFEERMGCGVGACYACIIPTNDGSNYKKICQDGPVFRAEEVSL